ncbi:MAG: hypothetical protein WCV63_03390 [Negativicutes bacterium]|jgi:hypothetical protein
MRRTAIRLTAAAGLAAAAIILALSFADAFAATAPDMVDKTLQNHERRIATQEERGRRQEIEISKLDEWYDTRINKMEKYYNAKIEKQERIDTELLATLDAAKTFIAFLAGITSLLFGWIGIRNILWKNKHSQ